MQYSVNLFDLCAGIITSSGDTWTGLRRFCSTVLRGLGVGKKSFEENIAIEVEFFIEELKKQRGSPFDPKHLLSNAVSNIICSVVLGKRFQYTDPMFRSLLKNTDVVVEGVGAGDIVELSPIVSKLTILPFVKRYIDASRKSIEQLRLIVEEHNLDYDAENPRDLIDMFLKETEIKKKLGDESAGVKMENLRPLVGELFVAGSETTNTTLRWSLLYMMAYPEIQSRVQKELDDVTGGNRFSKMSDKPNLPYTEAVLYEIQRISTIAPLAIPHYTSEDTPFMGLDIVSFDSI